MPVSVDLDSQLEDFVSTLVETGRYESEGAVLRAGIRMLQGYEARLAALDTAIERGLADADAGRSTPLEEVRERLSVQFGFAAR